MKSEQLFCIYLKAFSVLRGGLGGADRGAGEYRGNNTAVCFLPYSTIIVSCAFLLQLSQISATLLLRCCCCVAKQGKPPHDIKLITELTNDRRFSSSFVFRELRVYSVLSIIQSFVVKNFYPAGSPTRRKMPRYDDLNSSDLYPAKAIITTVCTY